jgi:3-oxoacyl-[acyl-carrier protein] reductase
MAQYKEYVIEGKVAIVTGGGTGIGEACAVELAKSGARVAVFGRRLELVEKTKVECDKYSPGALALSVDVGDEQAVKANVAKVLDEFGRVDILVNNAGIDLKIKIGESRWEDYFGKENAKEFLEYFRINALGHYLMNLAVIPCMRERRFGRIVNVSSVLANSGTYSTPGYTGSKGASVTITKAFAMKYAKDNITVNVVLPGFIRTPMKDDASPKELIGAANFIPMGRIGEPIDVARAVLFLAQENTYITGQAIAVSGGGE